MEITIKTPSGNSSDLPPVEIGVTPSSDQPPVEIVSGIRGWDSSVTRHTKDPNPNDPIIPELDVVRNQIAEQNRLNEFNSWRTAFTAINLVVEDEFERYVGKKSAILGRAMSSVEDVFKHITLTAVKDAKPKTERRQSDSERNLRVVSAGKAWRDAIDQRKVAMAQWDAYVKHLHDEFKRARES